MCFEERRDDTVSLHSIPGQTGFCDEKKKFACGSLKTEMYYGKLPKLQCGFVFWTFMLCVYVRVGEMHDAVGAGSAAG